MVGTGETNLFSVNNGPKRKIGRLVGVGSQLERLVRVVGTQGTNLFTDDIRSKSSCDPMVIYFQIIFCGYLADFPK